MGVPTSEVGYTSAMPRREDHEVRKGHVGHWTKKKKKNVNVNVVSVRALKAYKEMTKLILNCRT